MRCYSTLVAHKSWPVPGGSGAQAAAFVSAVSIADGERGVCEKDAMDRARKKSSPPPVVLGSDGLPMRQPLGQQRQASKAGEGVQSLEASF